ncbi:MAG: Rhs element Vgr protein [Telluria sp.]
MPNDPTYICVKPAARPRARQDRLLTDGEVAMARMVFGDALDYGRVRIFRRRYLPFGMQPRNCAMSPNGSIYFHQSCCLPDFSRGDDHAKHWFMHEMVHVWQHQLGYPVRLRGAIRIGLGYDYELDSGKTLADYNMEAQGDLLADYFVLAHLCSARTMRQPRYADRGPLFEKVLANFLQNPGDRSNLPRGFIRA